MEGDQTKGGKNSRLILTQNARATPQVNPEMLTNWRATLWLGSEIASGSN